MGLLFPFKVTIFQSKISDAPKPGLLPRPGLQPGYGGIVPSADGKIRGPIPANIVYRTQARGTGARLPTDTQTKTNWDITLRARDSKRDQIKQGFYAVDQDGNRYQITAAEWNTSGYVLRCELEKA
jgi:hypothetical protein